MDLETLDELLKTLAEYFLYMAMPLWILTLPLWCYRAGKAAQEGGRPRWAGNLVGIVLGPIGVLVEGLLPVGHALPGPAAWTRTQRIGYGVKAILTFVALAFLPLLVGLVMMALAGL